jgi:hypothetical protein
MTRTRATFYTLTATVLVAGVLLAATTLPGNRPAFAAPTDGLMPEVVVTAHGPDMVVDTIVVRPANTSDIAGTTPDKSGLN